MTTDEARAMIKAAAGKTYPVSRFLTSPKKMGLTTAGLVAAAGLGVAAAAGAPGVALAGLVAAPIYGGMAWGASRISRFLEARGLHSRLSRGAKAPFSITGGEEAAVADMLKAKLPKAAAFHPISEALTSRSWGVGLSSLMAAAAPDPVTIAGAIASPFGNQLRRIIHSRGLRGRLAVGEHIYGAEVDMIKDLQAAARKKLVKRVAAGAAIAGGVGAGAYSAKKLVEQDATA